MRRIVLCFLLSIFGIVGFQSQSTSAFSSDSKLFISGDNSFYSYVKGGETISAVFLRVNQPEPLDTVQGDITITIDGPGIAQQKCIASKDAAFGTGCRFAAITAPETGIYRIQFAVPADAKTFDEVSPAVKWGKNLFSWDITVSSNGTEQHGRTWTERYAIRQPPSASYSDDFTHYYISEDGYIYRAVTKGYNGQISTLSADAVGIRSGDKCVSAYRSTEVSDTKFSPALGACGNGYKLFFEEPPGDLPQSAAKWDKTTDWIRPNISRPELSGLKFTSDNSSDQQSGTISFSLNNFVGQYQIKVDTDGDGSFDGQDDVTLNEQIKKRSSGEQKIHFDGVDKTGQIIPPTSKIGIKVDITKVAEIHLVAADVEGRTGGIELTRLNGDNAPNSNICWNDTDLAPMSTAMMTADVDGKDCPNSIGGLHAWAYDSEVSWGNARYIDDWTYASAKLSGNNQIVYPTDAEAATLAKKDNTVLYIAIISGIVALITVILGIIAYRRRAKKNALLRAQSQSTFQPQQTDYPQTYDRPPGPN